MLWQKVVPYTNNEVWRLAVLVAAILAATILGRLQRYFLTRWAASLEHRGHTLWAVAVQAVARSATAAIVMIGMLLGFSVLQLPGRVEVISSRIIHGLIAATLGYIAWCLVDVAARWVYDLSARTAGRLDDMLVPLVTKSLRAAVVVLVIVQVLTELSGTPATSLIAGLGIGGLAIGLAAQDTIKNLFGSLMIFGDRPFELGDRIVVDGRDGAVETVGFRSTRIRTVDGLVTIPNGDLANKPILNIARQPFLKRTMNVRLSFRNSPRQVERALAILKEILQDHEGYSPQRPAAVIFNDITDTGFNISATYSYSPPDGGRFAAFNERVNMQILERFEQEGIELASPRQTLELADGVRPGLTTPTRRDAGGPPAKP